MSAGFCSLLDSSWFPALLLLQQVCRVFLLLHRCSTMISEAPGNITGTLHNLMNLWIIVLVSFCGQFDSIRFTLPLSMSCQCLIWDQSHIQLLPVSPVWLPPCLSGDGGWNLPQWNGTRPSNVIDVDVSNMLSSAVASCLTVPRQSFHYHSDIYHSHTIN